MKSPVVKSINTLKPAELVEGVRVGKIISINEKGRVFVDFPGNTQGAVPARFTHAVKLKMLNHAAATDQKVLLAFENSDPALPIVVDTVCTSAAEVAESPAVALAMERPNDVMVDGKRVTFDAKEEIVLRCGKASITLTKAGKVLIRGAYLLNRSSGVNRIRGGSVQIN